MIKTTPPFIITRLGLILSIGIILSTNAQQPTNTPLRTPCPHAIHINTNVYRGSLHFICLQVQANSWPRLDVIQYNNLNLVSSHEILETGINQMASFVDNEGTLRIILSVPNRVNGTSVYSIDSLGRPINERHTINTQLVSAMSIWQLDLNLQWQLAIAMQPSYEPYLSETINTSYPTTTAYLSSPQQLGPAIGIHSWRSTYFDKYQQIELPYDGRITKLSPMHINGQEFLIVAMEQGISDDQSTAAADSLIYKLDFGDGNLNWVHFQSLNTFVALDASSFAVTHRNSLHRDYYVALLGQIAGGDPSFGRVYANNEDNANNREFGLLIYKYFGDSFVLYRSIPAPGSTKLDTITYGSGNSYVIIALSSGQDQSISLFVFDGLNLKPLPGPQVVHASGGRNVQYQRRSQIPQGTIHLFIDPTGVSEQQQSINGTDEGSNSKRTFTMEEPPIPLPALAFSSVSHLSEATDFYRQSRANTSADQLNSSLLPETNKRVFHIPIKELLNDNSAHDDNNDGDDASSDDTQQQNSTQKRNFIPNRPALSSELFNWCKSAIDKILEDNYGNLTRQLLELPRIDQSGPIELHGNLLIEGNLHVSNLLYANKIGEVVHRNIIQQVYPEPMTLSMNHTREFDQIDQVMSEIDMVKQRVDQILVDDGTIQDVYTPLNFERLIIECLNPVSMGQNQGPNGFAQQHNSCPYIGAIKTNSLNDKDVSNIQQQALLSGRSMIITRDVRFEHLILHGQTKILDSLNDVPIEEIVFSRGEHHSGPITGPKRLREALYTSSNIIVDQWAGLRIDRNTVLTSSGNQNINADLKFSHVVIDGFPSNYSSRIEFLNGLHLDSHLEQIAQADQNNNFALPIRFDELILNGPVRFAPDSRLSSVDLGDLWRNTMFKGSHQNVTAPMEFSGDVQLLQGNDILVNGPVNGLFLNRDNVLMRNRDYDLNNAFVFHGDVYVDGNLELKKALNGIQVVFNTRSQQSELAILYDGVDQQLSGDKIFNNIKLGGKTTIYGQINGNLNLTHLHSLANNEGRPFRFANYRLSTGLSRPMVRFDKAGSIHIDSSINGVTVQTLCSIAEQASRAPVNHYRRLKFDRPISMRNLRCASINGFNNLTSSFLTRFGNQYVPGTLRLTNGLVFNSTIQIRRTFNGLNVNPLARAISQAISESQTGRKEILGDFIVDDLIVDEQIDGLQMSNIFVARADYPQIIRAPMTFEHLDIENVLIVGKDLSTNLFNGINMSELFTNTLQYDSPQVVYNHVEVNNLHVLPGTNLVTKSLNGFDLQRMYSDAVLIDTPQRIMAPKSFHAPVRFNDRVFLINGIDGLTEDEFKFNLLLQGDELIEDDLEFHNDVLIRKTLEIMTGSINDIDVNQFINLLLYENDKKSSLRLTGNSSIRFHDVELNNLALTGKIQNIDVSREAILKSQQAKVPQLLPAPQKIILGPAQAPQTKFVYFPAKPAVVQPISVLTRPPQPMPQPLNQSLFKVEFRPVFNETFEKRPREDEYLPEDQDDLVYKYNFVNLGGTSLVDAKLLEHQARLRQEAIKDLSSRINKFVSISFYYEITQKHPLLGPLLSDADNPISDEDTGPLLLLKGMSKRGEPCLQRGQTIAVMAPQRSRSLYSSQYTLSSQISETSQPILADSLILNGQYYLFILDLHPPQLPTESMSQVLVYTWDHSSGRYDLREQILIEGYPTALKAFTVYGRNQSLACFALANPRVSWQIGGHMISGPPLIRCQSIGAGPFSQQHVLATMANVFDLDVITNSSRFHQVVFAALAQHDTEQIGDLLVYGYDLASRQTHMIDKRRMVKPLKLHFVKQAPAVALSGSSTIHQLVVSEAITSNANPQALTRIFGLHLPVVQPQQQQQNPVALPYLNVGHLQETQVIRDNQFGDIQSVVLDDKRSMLFMKSTHSISIFAPTGTASSAKLANCSPEYVMVHKIPTKGANKFLVANSRTVRPSSAPFGHFLILSRDDCDHQKHFTVILKAKFQ